MLKIKHLAYSLLLVGAFAFNAPKAEAFGVGFGPIQFGVGDDGYYYADDGYGYGRPGYWSDRRAYHREWGFDQICQAIDGHYPIELTVVAKEKKDNEIKIVIKTITVDPYLIGVSDKGILVLRGKIENEKVVKEITVKFLDENKKDSNREQWRAKDRFANTVLSNTEGIATIRINSFRNLNVLENSEFKFDANKDKYSSDDIRRVICEISND